MSDWKDRLAEVDDDYLVGLSNKGIVKRAYKDKGEVAAAVQSMGEEASVKVGEETVTVRYPLAESKCSCPSRSMCRHVVQAILVLKESCLSKEATRDGAAGDEVPQAQGGETGGDTDTALRGEVPQAQGGEAGGDTGTALKREAGISAGSVQESREYAAGAEAQKKSPENGSGIAENTAVWKEINAYPFERLKKVLGTRQFQSFVNQAAAGIQPAVRSSSVVTVQLPRQEHTVKLLSPLEYSTCSCHKKEMCVHKAAAILWCQLESGVLTKKVLLGEIMETQEYDMARVKEAAGQMKVFLEELFATGLSRTSPDVLDYLERLAIISHNEGLAKFEGYFRALSDTYDRYFARKAAFKTEDLTEQITRLYRRVEMLLKAEDTAGVAGLAGEFRADYLPVGNLDLIGIAMEHFESRNGYEGETIYFLEEHTKKWYTYTNARPVFYDSHKKRGYTEKGQAPWGLNLTFENLLKVRIHLTGAKCDERNRLSSSQETKGEVTGEQGLEISDIKGWYYRDFDKVFSEQIWRQQRAWLAEQGDAGSAQGDGGPENGGTGKGVELVFVRPSDCARAEFSQTGQQLTLPLYDQAGRELLVEVAYSKQESGTIRYLERISERKLPCFIGKIYLKDGRVRMYPVDLIEIEEAFGSGDVTGVDAREEPRNPGQGDAAAHTEAEGLEEGEDSESGMEAGREAEEDGPGNAFTGRKTKYEAIEELAAEAASLLEDLFQSGFDTVHDRTLKSIQKNADLTAQFGMAYLSELLSGLGEEISLSRHRMEKRTAALAGIYTNVNEYLYFCRQKAAYDRGKEYYLEIS